MAAWIYDTKPDIASAIVYLYYRPISRHKQCLGFMALGRTQKLPIHDLKVLSDTLEAIAEKSSTSSVVLDGKIDVLLTCRPILLS